MKCIDDKSARLFKVCSWEPHGTNTKCKKMEKQNVSCRDVVLTKEVWESTQKTSHFETVSNTIANPCNLEAHVLDVATFGEVLLQCWKQIMFVACVYMHCYRMQFLPMIKRKRNLYSTIKPNKSGKLMAGICIALNYWGKYKRKMAIRSKLTAKQPAAIDISDWVHSPDTKLHYHYVGISELR